MSNESPLNKAEKKLRFSELRRDAQLNRINSLMLKRIQITTLIESEKIKLAALDREFKQAAQTFHSIRDGKTL